MSYFSVDEQIEDLQIINKSKFITNLLPISSQDEAQKYIEQISKKYSDATHNCYAYISNEIATEQKFSDDGEPQGTAGMPMLDVLKKKKVYMTLCVVTRYFGGIKLGANGLVSAYASSVAKALQKATIVENILSHEILITSDYSTYKKLEDVIRENEGQINAINYTEKVQISAIIPIEAYEVVKNKLIDTSNGQVIIEIKNTNYNKFKRGEV